MIHIEKDQKVVENEHLRVASETGDYEDSAQIEFYDIKKPDSVYGSFQAQYVKYGGLVYRFNSPRELGIEILRVDPNSTHTAASFVRISDELLAKLNDGSLEPSSLNAMLTEEQPVLPDKVAEPIEPVKPVEPTPPKTPKTRATETTPVVNVSTTTSATSADLIPEAVLETIVPIDGGADISDVLEKKLNETLENVLEKATTTSKNSKSSKLVAYAKKKIIKKLRG